MTASDAESSEQSDSDDDKPALNRAARRREENAMKKTSDGRSKVQLLPTTFAS
jgi:hypothetical protein